LKDFAIKHPGLKALYDTCANLSPILEKDRYTKPEFDRIYELIENGDAFDMVLDRMERKDTTQ